MNATTTKEHVNRWRAAHHSALETLANSINPENKLTGLQLWRKLVQVEREAHSGATAYCNGETYSAHSLTSTKQRLVWNFNADENAWENFEQWIEAKVAKVFGGKLPQGFFVNGDPRGYALKLDNESVKIPDGMHKDWGGYGILAAVIE